MTQRICGQIGCLKPAVKKWHGKWLCSDDLRKFTTYQTPPLTDFVTPAND